MSDKASPRRVRVGFVSAVEIGAACIKEIHDIGGHLDLIVTLDADTEKDKSGRADFADLALAHNCELIRIRNINDDAAVRALREADLDWLFIIGWSQIAKPGVLSVPTNGVIGAHPTLLPKGRGRAPIPWAILKDLPETGVTFFQIDEGVDTGPIIAKQRIPLTPTENAGTLYAKVVATHRELIRTIWGEMARGKIRTQRQNEATATYWPKRTPDDGEILGTMTVEEVDRLVRAVTHPYPGAFWLQGDRTLTVWEGSAARPANPRYEPLQVASGLYWPTQVTEH